MHSITCLLSCLLMVATTPLLATSPTPNALSPQAALQRLREGNANFASDKPSHADHSSDRRLAVAEKQYPFAVIVGCSDSRVGPEAIFDQGIGDLFVVRVAGNVVAPTEFDSIEYAIQHLGSSLIVVLGHERCGAIKAVLDGDTYGIKNLASLIQPALKGIAKESSQAWELAIKANVQHVIDQLALNPVVADQLQSGKVALTGGYYNLRTGLVEWIAPTCCKQSTQP